MKKSDRHGWRLALVGMWLLLQLSAAVALAQPRVIPSVEDTRVRVNTPFVLHIEVRWAGPLGRYVIYPPKLELPESIHSGAVQQHYETQETETVFSYQYTLTPTAPGEYDLGTVTLDYREMSAPEPASASPSVTEQAPKINVQPGGVAGIGGRVVIPLLGLGVVVLVFALYRRRTRKKTVPDTAPAEPTPEELVEKAHSHFIAGEFDKVYEILAHLKTLLPAADDPLPALDKLEAERLKARYGGTTGTKNELQQLLRSVEVLLRPSRHEN